MSNRLYTTATLVFTSLLLLGSAMTRADSTSAETFLDGLIDIAAISDPVLSPDGTHALYTVKHRDPAQDKYVAALWVVNTASGTARRLTYRMKEVAHPFWFPGREAVGFTAGTETDGEKAIWMLPLTGGEPIIVARLMGDILGVEIDPAGTQFAVALREPAERPHLWPEQAGDTAAPIVLKSFQLKDDHRGYLNRSHALLLIDAETGRASRLPAAGLFPEHPSFSPAGDALVYLAYAGPGAERTREADLFILPLDGSGAARQLTDAARGDVGGCSMNPLIWTEDGRSVICRGGHFDRDNLYAQHDLLAVDIESGAMRNLTGALDRDVIAATRSNAGSVLAVIEDDRRRTLIEVAISTGEHRTVLEGNHFIGGLDSQAGTTVARMQTFARPEELVRIDTDRLHPLTRHNRTSGDPPWRDATPISFQSADGTEVRAMLARPDDDTTQPRRTLLWIHGGPVSQFGYEFRLEPQWFLHQGFNVLMVNPRGSSGRGRAWASAIEAAWGSVDVADVLAGIDYLVAEGIADPDQLFIGGWSYGGMLTNYVIASTDRFRAALSGAAISNVYSGFGTDQYIKDYLSELGAPWEDREAWERVSYPFFKANRITTPTLFLVGENDDNVPPLASEQMYQALRVLGVATELVIYPGQDHGIDRPSYRADRLRRYLDWLQRYSPGDAADSLG